MHNIYGIILNKEADKITVNAPGVEANILLDWDKKDITVLNLYYTNHAVETMRSDNNLSQLKIHHRNLLDDFHELREKHNKQADELHELYIEIHELKKNTKEEEKGPFSPEIVQEASDKLEKFTYWPATPLTPAEIDTIETAFKEEKPKKKRGKKKGSANKKSAVTLAKENILEYGKRKGGEFTFRIHGRPGRGSTEEAKNEATILKTIIGFSAPILSDAMKQLIQEGKITRRKKDDSLAYIYTIQNIEQLLKKDSAPDVAGGLKNAT